MPLQVPLARENLFVPASPMVHVTTMLFLFFMSYNVTGTLSFGTPFTFIVTSLSVTVMSLKRAADTGVILLSSPSRANPFGKYGAMTQYWKSDFPH